MAKKFVVFFVFFTLFGFLLAPPGHAMQGNFIVENNLHDGIIGQWNEWSLQILDTSRYEFQKFSGISLPGIMEINEDLSNSSTLHIQGAMYGYQHDEDVTFTITAFDKENSQDVFQDLTIHVRHFSPEEIGELEYHVGINVYDVAYLENGQIQYNFDNYNPFFSPVLLATYSGKYSVDSARHYFSPAIKLQSIRQNYPKKSFGSRDKAWEDYSYLQNAVTIESTDQAYHYLDQGQEIGVPAGETQTFDIDYSYEYSRYFLSNSLAQDAYEALQNKKITWTFPDNLEHLSGETTFGRSLPFEERYVPKIEFL